MNALACAQGIGTHLAVQMESLDSVNPSYAEELKDMKDVLINLNLGSLDWLKHDRRALWPTKFI